MSKLSGKKVLCVFCHPDDEILWGWPVMQDRTIERHLIITCSDRPRNRPNRREALEEVCRQEHIHLQACLDIDNNFYTLPTRRADYLLTDAVAEIENIIQRAVDDIKPDFIFTHNPCGEYGHGSHRLMFEIISQLPQTRNLLISDICQKSNHRSSDFVPPIIWDAYYTGHLFEYNLQLDLDFYQRTKSVYNTYNAWTWSQLPIRATNLYLLCGYN